MRITRNLHSALLGFICLLGLPAIVHGMTYDNRFFPLLDKPVMHCNNINMFLRLQPIVFTAGSSFTDEDSLQEDSGLYQIWGKFRQENIDSALKKIGKIDKPLIRPDLARANFPWSQSGNLEGGGLAATWYYVLSPCFQIGGSMIFMGARTRLDSFLRDTAREYKFGDRYDLYKSHADSNAINDVPGLLWSNAGFGDFDFYLRYGTLQHYILKCKTIDAGIKLGMYAPLAERRNVDFPGSVAFGGNGHWGIYVDLALNAELKDDMFVGANMRFIQRLPGDERLRFPANLQNPEPLNYATVFGTARVDPGLTFVFNPVGGFMGLGDGFGAQIGYTLIVHQEDSFSDVRLNNDVPVNLGIMQRRSEWGLEYITTSLIYDCAKDLECRGSLPVIYLDVDIPIEFLASKRAFKTYGISLRIEMDL